MGYEVDVRGTIMFRDVEGFKKDFPYTENRNSEVGMHNDFNYFFTKVWGDSLERLDAYDGVEKEFDREGKNWYDLDKAINFLSKYADAELFFQGEEEGDTYKYLLLNGTYTRYKGVISYCEDK